MKNGFNENEDYYKILGISEDASAEEIDRAYRAKYQVYVEKLDNLDNLKNTIENIEDMLNHNTEPVLKRENGEIVYDKTGTPLFEVDDKGSILYQPLKEENREGYKISLEEIRLEMIKLEKDIANDKTQEAYTVLNNYRIAYDRARARFSSKKRVSSIEEAPEDTINNGKQRIKKVALSILTGALIIGTLAIGIGIGKRQNGKESENSNQVISTTETKPNNEYMTDLSSSEYANDIDEVTSTPSPSEENIDERNNILQETVQNLTFSPIKSIIDFFKKNVENITPSETVAPNQPTSEETNNTNSSAENEVDNILQDSPDMVNPDQPVNDGTNNTDSSTENKVNNTQDSINVGSNLSFGSITNNEDVTNKAQQLLNAFNSAKIINIGTGLPYEIEELKNLILFMNGAYVPESEQDIHNMYTKYIEFLASPVNTDAFLYYANYVGGEESFKPIIEENARNPIYLDIVQATCFEKSYGMEYAQWLQNQYFKLIYTTDKIASNQIYNEVWQSFAEIMQGNDAMFVLDNNVYTVNQTSLSTGSNVNVASLVTFWLHNFGAFRNKDTQEVFAVEANFVSADPNERITHVSIDEMFEYLNPDCEINILEDESNSISLDGYQNSWGERLQANLKAYGYEQLASRGHSLTYTPQQ